MIEYTITDEKGVLLDAGTIDGCVPTSQMHDDAHCMLKPPTGKSWGHNVEHWTKAGMTVTLGRPRSVSVGLLARLSKLLISR